MTDPTNLSCRFPDGFWFGSSTAGHQIEGDNIHCQDAHEEIHDPKGVRKAAGRVPSGKACDHWNRWRQDVDLLADLGHQAWRFSCEWSRIEPQPGRVDEAALARYIARSERLAELGIKQFITLCHWTHPQWFEELGGFAKDANLVHWERHVRRMGKHFGPFAAAWGTLNEVEGAAGAQMQRARGYARGHAIAYHTIKQYSQAPVGMNSGSRGGVYPVRNVDEPDRILAEYREWQGCGWWQHMIRTGELVLLGQDAAVIPDAKGTTDWWMLNAYRRGLVDSRKADGQGQRPPWSMERMFRAMPPGDRKAAGFEFDEMHPETLTRILEGLRDKPVLITENGLATDDDRLRIKYIAMHLAAVHRAMQLGVDVRGYLYWSTMDNYEWGSFAPRFGLVHVDFETFQRTPKPTAYFFRDIIRGNGLTREILEKNQVIG